MDLYTQGMALKMRLFTENVNNMMSAVAFMTFRPFGFRHFGI